MKKVLVIDNDEFIREFMKDLLTEQKCEVLLAEDGLIALDILNSTTPDCVFLDLVMSGIDGRKLCMIIRSGKRFEKTAIVVLSGFFAEMDVGIDDMGVQRYIAKGPFARMAQNIQEILKKLGLSALGHKYGDVFSCGHFFLNLI